MRIFLQVHVVNVFLHTSTFSNVDKNMVWMEHHRFHGWSSLHVVPTLSLQHMWRKCIGDLASRTTEPIQPRQHLLPPWPTGVAAPIGIRGGGGGPGRRGGGELI